MSGNVPRDQVTPSEDLHADDPVTPGQREEPAVDAHEPDHRDPVEGRVRVQATPSVEVQALGPSTAVPLADPTATNPGPPSTTEARRSRCLAVERVDGACIRRAGATKLRPRRSRSRSSPCRPYRGETHRPARSGLAGGSRRSTTSRRASRRRSAPMCTPSVERHTVSSNGSPFGEAAARSELPPAPMTIANDPGPPIDVRTHASSGTTGRGRPIEARANRASRRPIATSAATGTNAGRAPASPPNPGSDQPRRTCGSDAAPEHDRVSQRRRRRDRCPIGQEPLELVGPQGCTKLSHGPRPPARAAGRAAPPTAIV